MIRSVLSPADYPGVISVGALRDEKNPLVSSSRGYRSHSIQRVLPEFMVHGYKIPCYSTQLKCQGISGTSIAAPLFAGIMALKAQETSIRSPGLLRCLLHGKNNRDFCLVPDHLILPSPQYPSFQQPL